MASYFKQLTDDMGRVAELVTEGTKFMMGETTHMGGGGNVDATTSSDPNTIDNDVHLLDDEDGDAIFDDMDGMYEEGFGSPLMGMADSVMSDIMSTQVRCSMIHTKQLHCNFHVFFMIVASYTIIFV